MDPLRGWLLVLVLVSWSSGGGVAISEVGVLGAWLEGVLDREGG